LPDKALIIRDDKGKFKDLGDVLAVARSEGKKLFKTHENIAVVRLLFDVEVGWIAVVRCSAVADAGCSDSFVVSEARKK
jgi:hypothetical protein